MKDTEFDILMARLKRKGGRLHMSLKNGIVFHIKGDKPKRIVEPVRHNPAKPTLTD